MRSVVNPDNPNFRTPEAEARAAEYLLMSERVKDLERERDSLKEDLSNVRQCYYEVVGQRNDLMKVNKKLIERIRGRND